MLKPANTASNHDRFKEFHYAFLRLSSCAVLGQTINDNGVSSGALIWLIVKPKRYLPLIINWHKYMPI